MDLLFTIYLYIVAIPCIAAIAKNRNRSALGWATLALFITPVVAYATLIVMRDVKVDETPTSSYDRRNS